MFANTSFKPGLNISHKDCKHMFANTSFKPGLNISHKDRKHMFANTLLSFPRMLWSSHTCNDSSCSYFTRNLCNRYVESFQTFLGHDRKHVVRLRRLYGGQVYTCLIILLVTSNYRGTCGPSTINYSLNGAANA